MLKSINKRINVSNTCPTPSTEAADTDDDDDDEDGARSYYSITQVWLRVGRCWAGGGVWRRYRGGNWSFWKIQHKQQQIRES